MIRPMEFNVVVELDPIESKTPGGVWLLDTAKERDKLAIQEGTLVAASPVAFTYAEWPAGHEPPAVGCRVLFARYSGLIREEAGKTYRILKDKDVVAVIDTPSIAAAA